MHWQHVQLNFPLPLWSPQRCNKPQKHSEFSVPCVPRVGGRDHSLWMVANMASHTHGDRHGVHVCRKKICSAVRSCQFLTYLVEREEIKKENDLNIDSCCPFKSSWICYYLGLFAHFPDLEACSFHRMSELQHVLELLPPEVSLWAYSQYMSKQGDHRKSGILATDIMKQSKSGPVYLK